MCNKPLLLTTAAWVLSLLPSANVLAQSPDILWKRQVNSDRINTVIFNSAGDTLIAGSSDRLIQFWRVSDGTLLRTLNSNAPYVHESAVESLSITPDGTKLASASYQIVKLWTLPTGTEQDLNGHSDWVVSVAFSPNGQYLASASFDQSIRIWRASDGVPLRTLIPSTLRQMRAVAFSPDSALLAGAGGDDIIHLWRTSDWTEVRQLVGHTDDIYTVTFSPDGTKIASGGYDQTARIWNTATGALLYTLAGNGGTIYGVAFSPEGTQLAYTDGEGSTIRVHRVSDGARLQLYTDETFQVQTVAFSAGGLLGYGRADKAVILASIGTNNPPPPPPPPATWVLSTAVSGSGTIGVTPAPNGPNGTYTNGTIVKLTATANSGNYFVKWQGAVASTSPTISLTMNTNKAVTAVFAVNATPPPVATQIVWQTSDNKVVVWAMDGTSRIAEYYLFGGSALASGWKAIATADFNKDGDPDLLLESVNRTLAIIHMRGDSVLGWSNVAGGQRVTTGWEVVGVGDINRDGYGDVLLESTEGRAAAWYLNDAKFISSVYIRNGTAAGSQWRIRAVGDFNHDGNQDLIWQNTNGVCTLWLMRGTALSAWMYLRGGASIGAGWKIAAAGDLSRDGENDILLHHDNGKNSLWLMRGAAYQQSKILTSAPSTWRVVGFR